MTDTQTDRRTTLIPLPEAAARIGVHVITLRKGVNSGQIPSVQVQKRKYLTEEIIQSILKPETHHG